MQERRQKRVLALHDLASFGRAALVPVMTALEAMGHQCVPVPTAVFSSHTALPGWHSVDLTGWMGEALAQYREMGLRFDAVSSGFLSDAAQIDRVLEAQTLKTADGIALVDPVMGDRGRLYQTYTPALVARMGELCTAADVITPNLTEAAVLLELPPDARPRDEEEAAAWALRLHLRYGVQVVMTGRRVEGDQMQTMCVDEMGECTPVENPRIGAYYPGTGDLFSAVLLGALLRGDRLAWAAQSAADFVCACVADTAAAGTDPLYGAALERSLWRLTAGRR